jgi:sirohydrochlorin cobaltochelatase
MSSNREFEFRADDSRLLGQRTELPANNELGILLVGHGTRDKRGTADFLAVGQCVAAKRDDATIEPCFLELCEPSIPAGIARLIAADVKRIVVAPLLLFAAGHIRRDIPRAVTLALREHPNLVWTQARHLGCHPAILLQSEIRFHEAAVKLPAVEKNQTLLLFVGRGSTDEEAIQEAHAFAAAAAQSEAVAQTLVCFYAMAKPSLEASLERAARAGCRRVVVQLHLLFEGQIAEAIRNLVRATAARHPQIEWIVTEPLGPTGLVAQAVTGRVFDPPMLRDSV